MTLLKCLHQDYIPLMNMNEIICVFLQWSFGVTVWEVYSLGKMPYPGVSNYSIPHFLSTGRRLERPDRCPDTV